MEDNSLYKEGKRRKGRGSAEKEKEKEMTSVYAYTMTVAMTKAYRACGVWGCRLIDERPQQLVYYKSLNDPSLFGLKSKRKKLKSIWNTTVYKERKRKEQQGRKEVAEKDLTCVYAYNDGDNHRNRVQGMRGRGVRNDL